MGAKEIIQAQADTEATMLRETLTTLNEELTAERWDNERLTEAISNLDLYLDNRGWTSISGIGGYGGNGPSLNQLHASSRHLRDLAGMTGWVKRGLNLRQGYVWDGGIHYDLPPLIVDDETPQRRGARTNEEKKITALRERINNPINQRYFFGSQAHERREMALYCDSQPFYVGDDADFTLTALPITQITADYRNPDKDDEIWAYRHSWQSYPQGSSTPVEKHEWIFCNGFTDKIGSRKTLRVEGASQADPIAIGKRMFGTPVNRPDGWAYGLPDSLGGVAWVEQYRQFMMKGKEMSDAMARLWGTMKAGTQRGANRAAATMREMDDEKVAILGPNNAMSPLATAGQSYDFAKGIDLLAGFAAHINVSVVALSANPATSGGSYGSARALDLPEQLTTTARRQYHIDLDREVLVWMGADPEIDIWFDPIEDETERYRADQRIALRMGTGLFSGEDTKAMYAELDGRHTITKVPTGWLEPNNRKSLPRKDIDTDSAGADPAAGGDFTPTQGSGSNFTGGGSGDQRADDLRTEAIARAAVDHYILMREAEGD